VKVLLLYPYENESNKDSDCGIVSGFAGFSCHSGALDELFAPIVGRAV
jgi:hypothetical protein